MNRRRFVGVLLGLAGIGTWLSTRTQPAPIISAMSPDESAAVDGTTPGQSVPQTLPTTTTTTTVPLSAVLIPVIGRDSWGAAPVTGEGTGHEVVRLTVHHTAALLESNGDAPTHVRNHQAYHQSLGWVDLAYHFIVDRNGHVYEGRNPNMAGDTATDYDPTGHFLVCCEGDFSTQTTTPEQLASAAALLAWASQSYNVSLDTIAGHRDLASTMCPGDVLYDQLGALAAQARLIGADGDVELSVMETAQGVARVAEIEAGEV